MLDIRDESITSRQLSPSSLEIDLAALEAGRVYELTLDSIEAADGSKPLNDIFYYTANQLRK